MSRPIRNVRESEYVQLVTLLGGEPPRGDGEDGELIIEPTRPDRGDEKTFDPAKEDGSPPPRGLPGVIEHSPPPDGPSEAVVVEAAMPGEFEGAIADESVPADSGDDEHPLHPVLEEVRAAAELQLYQRCGVTMPVKLAVTGDVVHAEPRDPATEAPPLQTLVAPEEVSPPPDENPRIEDELDVALDDLRARSALPPDVSMGADLFTGEYPTVSGGGPEADSGPSQVPVVGLTDELKRGKVVLVEVVGPDALPRGDPEKKG